MVALLGRVRWENVGVLALVAGALALTLLRACAEPVRREPLAARPAAPPAKPLRRAPPPPPPRAPARTRRRVPKAVPEKRRPAPPPPQVSQPPGATRGRRPPCCAFAHAGALHPRRPRSRRRPRTPIAGGRRVLALGLTLRRGAQAGEERGQHRGVELVGSSATRGPAASAARCRRPSRTPSSRCPPRERRLDAELVDPPLVAAWRSAPAGGAAAIDQLGRKVSLRLA